MTFITNSGEKSLEGRIVELIERSQELKFLTAFFYFSGLRELYESLKKLETEGKTSKGFLKILVGLDVDEKAGKLYEYARDYRNLTLNQTKEAFLESLKKAFNSEDLDNKEIAEQVEFFLKLLSEGKLIIKKTKEPNHAKLYLFKLDEKEVIPSLFITGSSNLTRAGLKLQEEFNVEIKDYGFEEAEKYFDELWNKAVGFTPEDVKKIIKTIREETFLKEITPFQAWVYLLNTYIDLHRGVNSQEVQDKVKHILERAGYRAINYQVEAVLQALKMCETHRGVLLADVVGLGKTVIACALAKMLNKRGIVICPPHLVGDEGKTFGWKKYLEDFELYDWEVRSLGKLKDALEFVKERGNIEVVIVDEAHRFRNENTERYHYLREICRGRIVILLTATPFNNRPSDIFALLKLFTIPKKSTLVIDEDLKAKFDEYERTFELLSYIKNYHNSKDSKRRKRSEEYYRKLFNESPIDISKVDKEAQKLAKTIRGILEPIVIRRNRLDLKYYGEEIPLSEVKDPEEWFYELTEQQLEFYDEVIETFYDVEEGGKFTGAIYFPVKYEKKFTEEELDSEESFMFLFQKNLYDFMRRLLVKRFESSFKAFIESVKRFIEIHKTAIEFIDKTGKFILDRKLMEEIVEAEDDEEIWEKLEKYKEELKQGGKDSKYHKIYEINKLKQGKKFKEDILRDKELFEKILKKCESLNLLENDPKVKRLIEGIKDFLKEKRKVVIFTEYVDTAKYLEEVLRKEFEDKLLVAIGNLSRSTIEAIYKNFDAQYKHQENRYQILLTTDKLSEGFNLNRAGVVINYDIPWNPVRVIQRVGRINRISKKVYDEIYIVNFFPTEKGADIVKSREIAQSKMFMIHKILGEDAKIFSPDEEPQPATLYRRLNEYREDEGESFFTRVKRDLEEIKRKYPQVLEEIKGMPPRVKVAKNGDKNELFVFIKKGNDLFIGYKDYESEYAEAVSFDVAYERVKVEDKDQPRLPLSEHFWSNYHLVLEKHFEKSKSTQEKGKSNLIKARNLLKSIIDNEELKSYQEFISNLIEDIDNYGTISEYFISKILDLREFIEDIEKLKRELDNLKEEIGEDFLERAMKYFDIEKLKETIIITIENRRVENG